MIINFRAHGISRGTRKLTRTHPLILKKKKDTIMETVRGLGAGRANEGTLPRIRQRWTAAETNSAGSVQGSVQDFELATWHGRGA